MEAKPPRVTDIIKIYRLPRNRTLVAPICLSNYDISRNRIIVTFLIHVPLESYFCP